MTSAVSEIIVAAQNGDKQAAAQLLPMVYDELRKLAAVRIARETDPQTLNPTALVHEAYLRLVGTTDQARWDGRGHFFAAAAEAMRRILVDSARRKQSQKHGGGLSQVADVNELNLPLKQSPEQIVAVSEALDGLARVNDKAAELVKLRYFAGFTIPEAAEVLGIAPRTADNLWSYARAWLAVQLRGP